MERRIFLLALILITILGLAGCEKEGATAIPSGELATASPSQSALTTEPTTPEQPAATIDMKSLNTLKDFAENLPSGFELQFVNDAFTRAIFDNGAVKITVDRSAENYRSEGSTRFYATEVVASNISGIVKDFPSVSFVFREGSSYTVVSEGDVYGYSRDLTAFLRDLMTVAKDEVEVMLGPPEGAQILNTMLGGEAISSIAIIVEANEPVISEAVFNSVNGGSAMAMWGNNLCMVNLRPNDQANWSDGLATSAALTVAPDATKVIEAMTLAAQSPYYGPDED